MELAERTRVGRASAGRRRLGLRLPEWWPAPLIVLGVLGLWELMARAGLISALFFPAPTTVLSTLVRLTREGDLLPQLSTTALRMGRALAIGGTAGLLVGWGIGWSRRARVIVDPLIALVHPIPKIALFPIILLIFGIGEASKTVAIAISVFFPLAINGMAGVRQISPIHFAVARSVGAGRWLVLRRIVIPGSLPVVMAGVRLALNMGLVITIAIELVSSRTGLGAMLWLAWETFRPEEVYAVVVVLALFGLVINGTVQATTRRLVPWKAEDRT